MTNTYIIAKLESVKELENFAHILGARTLTSPNLAGSQLFFLKKVFRVSMHALFLQELITLRF